MFHASMSKDFTAKPKWLCLQLMIYPDVATYMCYNNYIDHFHSPPAWALPRAQLHPAVPQAIRFPTRCSSGCGYKSFMHRCRVFWWQQRIDTSKIFFVTGWFPVYWLVKNAVRYCVKSLLQESFHCLHKEHHTVNALPFTSFCLEKKKLEIYKS